MLSLHLSHVAIKQALYLGLADAARTAYAEAKAAKTEPQSAVRAALYMRANEIEQQLRSEGYGASFWCGYASEQGLSDASVLMASSGKPELPAGALPLSSPLCASSFDADLLESTLHIRNFGLSFYSRQLGLGFAARFPPGFEVGF
jgi:hypothetical protein